MNVDIFLMCHNEAAIIRQTIQHYQTLLPRCTITILDNMSTDGSVDIARQHRCRIKPFQSNNQMDAMKMMVIRNNCWKQSINRWVIVADMDEWICVNEQDLRKEDNQGTTILTIKGYNMIGDSKETDVHDINLHELHRGVDYPNESKSLCFKVGPIKEMLFTHGCHSCTPIGTIRYSTNEYILKHMDYLGLPYKLKKQEARYRRSAMNRQRGFSFHYATPLEEIRDKHPVVLESTTDISALLAAYKV